MDVECLWNYFLIKFRDLATGVTTAFEQFDGHLLDIAGVADMLRRYRIVTFNGQKYDMPMVAFALTGATCDSLKQASDLIIRLNLQPWQFEDQVGVKIPTWIDHVDIFEVCPAPKASLKIYGGRIHSQKMQDLPFDPDARLDVFGRIVTREYCGNDLKVTEDLYRELRPQLELRDRLSRMYGIDLRSKSDAQIAEAVIKVKLGYKPARPVVQPGTTFHYRAPDFIAFHTPQMRAVLDMLARSPFTIAASGAPEMTKELANTRIVMGPSTYQMGMGGLHSNESGAAHVTNGAHVLSDHDVASYYPAIILRLGMSPPQIGEAFQAIYRGIVDQRLAAKRAGDKATADGLKITVNGTFGKLGSKWSFLYAPDLLIQTTITGQLALLMLIEALDLCGIPVVSANTDGVVVKCPRGLEWLRDECIRGWEAATGFETEATHYAALYSRDVNNYIAIKPDGTAKTKGAYAAASLQKNPTSLVCVDAVTAFLTRGVAVEETIRECRDVRRFVTIRQVKGGGEYRGEYLGRAVRWYYARGAEGHISYVSNGNKVARSDGARPIMELPDTLPDDVDRDWYIAEARGMLADVGYLETAVA
jgi:hypothetical protein